jgi:hypothetical protein
VCVSGAGRGRSGAVICSLYIWRLHQKLSQVFSIILSLIWVPQDFHQLSFEIFEGPFFHFIFM